MSSFQRMIAIPQEEYLALSSFQNVREPLAQHFHKLEERYTAEEREKDPYRRMVLQSNTLDQMKQVKEQLRNSLTVSTPKPYQSRAKALFQTLDGVLKFNDKGEIYSDDGNLISGSRVEDLIQHAVRDRRRNLTPAGWSDFLTVLRDHNVPKSILNRSTLDEMEEKAAPVVMIKRETSPISQTRLSRAKERQPRLQPARKYKPEASAFAKQGNPKRSVTFLKSYKNG